MQENKHMTNIGDSIRHDLQHRQEERQIHQEKVLSKTPDWYKPIQHGLNAVQNVLDRVEDTLFILPLSAFKHTLVPPMAEAGELVMGAALEGIKWIERGAAVGQQYDTLESHYTFGTPMPFESVEQAVHKADQEVDRAATQLVEGVNYIAGGVHSGLNTLTGSEVRADLLTDPVMMVGMNGLGPIARGAGRLLNTGVKAASQMRMKLFDIRSSYTVDWKGMMNTSYSGLPFPQIKIKQTLGETAAQRVAENPMLMKQYVQHMEKITELKLHSTQVDRLKEVLRTTKFEKLDSAAQVKHRKEFRTRVNNLRTEWEFNTGQKWPVYDKDYYNKTNSRRLRAKGDPYDAHHVILNNHAGPNEWWNVHPAHFLEEHPGIHGSGAPSRAIFNGSKKGDK